MTSNHLDKEAENQEFVFGEYVSPNPKSISLGVKLRPDPLISYKTDKTVKTECKPIQQQREEFIDNEKKNDKDNGNDKDNNNKNTEITQIRKSKKLQATPLKIKVSKQQNEIDSLKAQLFKLQLENERLKSESQSQSQSNSITPKNEENEENQDLVKRNISFNESVNILDIDSQQNTKLNDKASIMRSNRNSTPYKPKSIKSINPKQINMNNKENKENQENIMISTTNKQSRGSYRITPIPTRQGQRKITFKSRLQSINDNQELNKNNMNKNNINKNNINKNNINKNNGEESRESSLNLSFNLGQPRLSTPSFLKGGSTPSLSNNSSFVEDTPDINNIGADLTKTGSGASNFVSPILTPNNSKPNTKPFLFEWNKKK